MNLAHKFQIAKMQQQVTININEYEIDVQL